MKIDYLGRRLPCGIVRYGRYPYFAKSGHWANDGAWWYVEEAVPEQHNANET